MTDCKCGAPLMEIQIPHKTMICTRTKRFPCTDAPLPAQDVGLTDVEWSRRRSEAWGRFVDAQEGLAVAAAHYADVCFRSAIAPRHKAPFDIDICRPGCTCGKPPVSQADGSAS